MQLVAIILVLFSALCHAAWNFFIKKSRHPTVAYWWMMATALTVYLPLFIYTASGATVSLLLVGCVIASGLTKAAYYISLGATYQSSDLSIGYPIARSGVLLIPVWAFFFLGERIALSAAAGIVLILVGVYLLNVTATTLKALLPTKQQLNKGFYMALITAVMMSIYSVIDKAGVIAPGLGSPQLRAFNFLYVMFFASFVFLTPYVWGAAGWEVMRTELRGRLGMHTLMGLLDLTGYLGLLLAMQLTQVSYALALKQMSIVIGALMGTVFLHEKYGTNRVLASLVIFAGSWLVSISK